MCVRISSLCFHSVCWQRSTDTRQTHDRHYDGHYDGHYEFTHQTRSCDKKNLNKYKLFLTRERVLCVNL